MNILAIFPIKNSVGLNIIRETQRIASVLALMLVMASCKAQNLPSYVSVPAPSHDSEDAMEYVNWYNATVKNPTFDTVTVFRMPEFSDLRYVIIRPISIARVEYKNGRFIGWLSKESQWIETVKFDTQGRVVGGMNEIMISAIKEKGLIVQYERCPECNFKPNDKGKL